MKFEQYQPATTATANTTGIFIPAPNTQVFDQIAAATYKMAEQNLGDATQLMGMRDAERSDAPVDIGPVARLFTPAQRYQEGANQVLAVRKKLELEGILGDLQKDPNLQNDPKAFSEAYKLKRKDWLGSVPGFLQTEYAKLADNVQTQAVGQIQQRQVALARDQRATDTITTLDALRSKTYDEILSGKISPEEITERHVEMVALLQGAVKAGDLTASQMKQQLDQAGFNIRKAETLKAFRANPTMAFVDAIKNGKETFDAKGPPLTPEQREHLGANVEREFHILEARARQAQAAANANLAKQKNDDLVSRETRGEGILSPEQVDQMHGKNTVAAAEFKNQQRLSTETFHFRNSIGFTSQAEDVQKLQQFLPQPGSVGYADSMKVYEANRKVLDQKWTAIYGDGQRPGDPAQYLISRSPEIQGLISSDKPEERSRGYAMIGQLQTDMGINPGRQSIIPNVTAQNFMRDLQVASPEDAANMVAGLTRQYGEHTPKVLRQLADLKMPKEYQVLGMLIEPGDEQTRVELATALKTPMKDLTENLDKRVPGVKTEMDRGIQKGLADFNRTAQAQRSSELLDTMNDAVTRLAYFKAGMGMNKDEAVKYAVKALTGRWDYVGDARVPRGMAAPAENAMDYVKSNLTSDQLAPIKSDPIYTPEQVSAEQLRRAKSGRWVTNEMGDGLILLYPNGQPVIRRGPPAEGQAVAPSAPGQVGTDVQTRALTNRQTIQTSPNPADAAKVQQAEQNVMRAPQRPHYVEIKYKDAPDLAKLYKPAASPAPINNPMGVIAPETRTGPAGSTGPLNPLNPMGVKPVERPRAVR